MSRSHIENSGYLHSFPHLLGAVCCLHGNETEIRAAVDALQAKERLGRRAVGDRPRADPGRLLPALSAGRGARRAFRTAACCSTSPAIASATSRRKQIDRFQSFRMREFVRIGTPEQVMASASAG